MGVDNFIPVVLWSKYFLESQVYITNTDIFQDNQSSILLENSNMVYSVKINIHINIINLLMSDRVKYGEMRITYCPTGNMTGDYFTNSYKDPISGNSKEKLLIYK